MEIIIGEVWEQDKFMASVVCADKIVGLLYIYKIITLTNIQSTMRHDN
jgi:hypothetical protein